MDAALAAAERVVAVQSAYAARGIGLAQAALAGASRFELLRHYPREDVVDVQGCGQFYYHAHGSSRCPADEHGHFHLFARRAGEPPAHLVALSLDARGLPLRWFTVNRWVTGTRWLDADTSIAALQAFAPRASGRLAPVAQWLGAMTVLFASTTQSLLQRRDAIVARRLRQQAAEAFFEDRSVDVIAESPISLPRQLARLAPLPRRSAP